jgi:hypothetical protein
MELISRLQTANTEFWKMSFAENWLVQTTYFSCNGYRTWREGFVNAQSAWVYILSNFILKRFHIHIDKTVNVKYKQSSKHRSTTVIYQWWQPAVLVARCNYVSCPRQFSKPLNLCSCVRMNEKLFGNSAVFGRNNFGKQYLSCNGIRAYWMGKYRTMLESWQWELKVKVKQSLYRPR